MTADTGGTGPAGTAMIEVTGIDTPALGDRSYLATDGQVAMVVDPQRDIDRVLAAAASRGVRITHVFETHIHNDYVSGGLALARVTGASYHVNAADAVGFDRVPVREGDTLGVGDTMTVRVLATPGHTFTHLSYVLQDAPAGRVAAVFTGGSLLYGSTGRPDLLGPAHRATLAAAQYASAGRLASELPDDTPVWPTHGFGSFCTASPGSAAQGSAAPGPGRTSTIGQEKLANPVLRLAEHEYVTELLAGLDAYPAYYAHMAPANAAGAGPIGLAPPAVASPAQVAARIGAGEWVVDLRSRRAFAAGHVTGSLCFEHGTDFTNYLGWLIPWGTPLTLLGETPDQVATAQRELARIGIDRLAGAASGDPREWAGHQPLSSFPVATFAGLAAARQHRPVIVLDVRRRLEWADGHLDGALHIPLPDLPDRLGEVPRAEVWVHCRSGYRAAIAASLLQAAGRTVVSVDDDFSRAGPAGLRVVTGPAGRGA
jgi:glyoxylase-like metal-dependent hydrolase (beta-lactamase superfamily II)/rhodanese-related sulfurtransferase